MAALLGVNLESFILIEDLGRRIVQIQHWLSDSAIPTCLTPLAPNTLLDRMAQIGLNAFRLLTVKTLRDLATKMNNYPL